MGKASGKLGPGRTGSNSGRSYGGGHGPMFGKPSEAVHFGAFPDGGGYPLGFVEWAYDMLGGVRGEPVNPDTVLHLCSGSVKTGVRVDIRPEMAPTILADCRNVPLPDESVDVILADPPYSAEYAANLYGTGSQYPKPYQLLKEACRLLKPGGLVGLLHHQVPIFKRPLKLLKVYAVHRGLGFNLVAFTLLQKTGSGTFDTPDLFCQEVANVSNV